MTVMTDVINADNHSLEITKIQHESYKGQLIFARVWQSLQTEIPADSCRLFHGRGHCYPDLEFLTIDWFAPLVLVILYKAVDDDWLAAFCEHVQKELEDYPAVECVLLQKRFIKGSPTELLAGELPVAVYAKEGTCRYALSFQQKQNSGFFLDMAPGRQWVKDHARGKKVLNLFAYTCSFSVAALAGGASEVVNLDMSSGALAVGRENHRLNGMEDRLARDVRFFAHDLFRSWGKLKRLGPYDLIIVDPPSFQKGSFVVERDYAKVIRRLLSLLSDQGDLLLCLNAPWLDEQYFRQLVAANASALQFVERIEGRADFPEVKDDAALKVMHYCYSNQR